MPVLVSVDLFDENSFTIQRLLVDFVRKEHKVITPAETQATFA